MAQSTNQNNIANLATRTSGNCGCEDISKKTANTGIGQVSVGNSSLNATVPTGIITVFTATAGANGSIIKSIIIKATQPSQTGMVRLFVSDPTGVYKTLYKEVEIPINPALASTPTPVPILPMVEIKLLSPLKLKPGYMLLASTQNSEPFNIIVEGLDWTYLKPFAPYCCNFEQTMANTGNAQISVANTALDGTGTIVPIYTTNATNGSRILSIVIKALQSTHEGMIRLFVSTPPTAGPTYAFSLYREIPIPQSDQSAFVASFKVLIDEDWCIEDGYVIGASTQNNEAFAITIDGEDWSYPI